MTEFNWIKPLRQKATRTAPNHFAVIRALVQNKGHATRTPTTVIRLTVDAMRAARFICGDRVLVSIDGATKSLAIRRSVDGRGYTLSGGASETVGQVKCASVSVAGDHGIDGVEYGMPEVSIMDDGTLTAKKGEFENGR